MIKIVNQVIDNKNWKIDNNINKAINMINL